MTTCGGALKFTSFYYCQGRNNVKYGMVWQAMEYAQGAKLTA